MAKIELSVAQHYVDWDLWCGVRELVQNGLDARTDGHEFEITYSEKYEQLRLVTKGPVLETRSLLLGVTSKRDRADQIGKFGEGYKLALLALINAGHPVVIRTGADKWVPEIAPSEKFNGEPVLVIDQQKGVIKHRNAIEIEVDKVSAMDWVNIQNRLLPLRKAANEVRTECGAIIFDKDKKGQIYVGGIYVQQIGDLTYGYDFLPGLLKLDRDRRMTDRWDLSTLMEKTWFSAVKVNPEMASTLAELLKKEAGDVYSMRHSYFDADNRNEVRRLLANTFLQEYGDNALPVQNTEEIEEAKSYGRRGVVVPESLYNVLKNITGTLELVKADPSTAIVETHQVESLSEAELANLERVRDLLSKSHEKLAGLKFLPTTFRDPKQIAMVVKGETALRLSRGSLANLRETLRAAVREAARAFLPKNALGATADAADALWANIVAIALGVPGETMAPETDANNF